MPCPIGGHMDIGMDALWYEEDMDMVLLAVFEN